MKGSKYTRRTLLKSLSFGLLAIGVVQIPLQRILSGDKKESGPQEFGEGSIFQPREDQRAGVWAKWRELDSHRTTDIPRA